MLNDTLLLVLSSMQHRCSVQKCVCPRRARALGKSRSYDRRRLISYLDYHVALYRISKEMPSVRQLKQRMVKVKGPGKGNVQRPRIARPEP